MNLVSESKPPRFNPWSPLAMAVIVLCSAICGGAVFMWVGYPADEWNVPEHACPPCERLHWPATFSLGTDTGWAERGVERDDRRQPLRPGMFRVFSDGSEGVR